MSEALFANQRETNIQSTVALIEEVLGQLGHDPAAAATTTGDALHAWRIVKGSAVTLVTLVNRTLFTHVRVCSVVMSLDAKVDRNALHAHLLELNGALCGAAFATAGNQVLMVSERTTLDIDRSEVRELIRRVTTYADDHDDALVSTFGGHMGAAG
jgi:Putative bacterial sensory transduction regulator